MTKSAITKQEEAHECQEPKVTRPPAGNDKQKTTRHYGRRTGGLPKTRGIQSNIPASLASYTEVSSTSMEEGIHQLNKKKRDSLKTLTSTKTSSRARTSRLITKIGYAIPTMQEVTKKKQTTHQSPSQEAVLKESENRQEVVARLQF